MKFWAALLIAVLSVLECRAGKTKKLFPLNEGTRDAETQKVDNDVINRRKTLRRKSSYTKLSLS